MTTFRNISEGPRGIHTALGALVMLDAGQTSADIDVTETEVADARETGWFEIDGVPPAARPSGSGGDAAEEVAKLIERAELAELERDVVREELATIKRSKPIVSAAVAELDPANDDHWTKTGLPAVDAVKAIVGSEVSRDDIEAAAPDAKRPGKEG